MKIQVNEKTVEVPSIITIQQLLVDLDKPLLGSAVAVNQNIISRSQWPEYTINEGDNISLFQAIAGG